MDSVYLRTGTALAAVVMFFCGVVSAGAQDRFEAPPINYSGATPDNPVARLREAVHADPGKLVREDRFGYLRSVLSLLNVPVESQVLVFSKTSLQQRHIAPSTPRALYFNDDVYVGTMPEGDVLEISVADPALGTVFYTLTQHPDENADFIRQVDNCLQCHGSTLTGGIPGHVMRSVYADAAGYPILSAGSYITTQNSLFTERWGGWYVTGSGGGPRHMGNLTSEAAQFDPGADREAVQTPLLLAQRVDPARYLSPQSDIVALLILAHQTQAHNLMTQANFETQYALRDQEVLDKMLNTPEGPLSDSTRRRIDSAVNKLADYLLFAGEPRLESPIVPSNEFAKVFAAAGPRDVKGRSLRDLDLQTRLFKYPLSYLIYSAQFDGLPAAAKAAVYQRLWDLLADTNNASPYDLATRQAIRQIVLETKSGLPAYWQ